MGLFDWLRGRPSREAFARLVTEELRRRGMPAEFDAATFSVSAGPDKRLNLGNAYHDYCDAPRDRRREVLERYVGVFESAGEALAETDTFEEKRAQLLPRIRERSYLEFRRLSFEIQGNEAPALPHRVLAQDLIVFLVIDLPQAILEVDEDRLKRWKVDFDRALAAARENLWERSKERLTEVAPGVWSSPWKDNHDAGRLLLHDLVWQYKVQGDPVAVVPNRDTLLVTGADDRAGLEKMLGLAEEAIAQARPMTPVPVRLREREWIPFEVPPTHPLARTLRRLRVLTLARDYGEQKELLDSLHEKKGDDVFVATFTAVEDSKTGEASSYCVWSEGLPSLLPESDRVGFFRPSMPKDRQVVAMVEWAKVREKLGDLMTRERRIPERWRVRRFPTPEEIDSLRA